MSYLYSERNLLEVPHTYMYTAFEGVAFLESYIDSRLACLRGAAPGSGSTQMPDPLLLSEGARALAEIFDAASPRRGSAFRQLSGIGGQISRASEAVGLNDLADRLSEAKITHFVATSELLTALVASQLAGAHPKEVKFWLDRLVQRFEVTKKLFDGYQSGFRKGQGSSDSVRLYWLLALALCLFYSTSNQIKYLSTLLKVCDLLCSLPGTQLKAGIPPSGLAVVLAAEIGNVQRLAEMKELAIGLG